MPWWFIQVLGFLLLCIAYRAYRGFFARLPLHMDTAYYVTNHAITTRRYRPFKSWNALFSGGSRLLPELVHTLLFLRLGGERYAAGFRELYTWLACATATACGFIAAQLVPHELAFWIAACACAALLAEVQYGTYFESAETFENVFQSVGMALVLCGLEGLGGASVALGIALLWADFSLIKLTGALPAGLVSAALGWSDRSWIGPVLAIFALNVIVYAALVRSGDARFGELLACLRRHEAYVRRNHRNSLKLVGVKLGFIAILVLRNPALPLLAAVGMVQLASVAAAARQPLYMVYGAFVVGAAGAMIRQGNRVWYYMLPLLPPLAVLVTIAFASLPTPIGLIAACAAIGGSILRNLWHVHGLSPLDASRRVFAVYNRPGHAFGDTFARTNLEVQLACEQMRESVRGATALVVGRYNQANVLLEAAYDTPIASVCELSEAVAGDLRKWLPDLPREELPAFLVDTDDELPVRAAQLTWMQDYELSQQIGPIRLYARRAYRRA
jgi:hypothetical protein